MKKSDFHVAFISHGRSNNVQIPIKSTSLSLVSCETALCSMCVSLDVQQRKSELEQDVNASNIIL